MAGDRTVLIAHAQVSIIASARCNSIGAFPPEIFSSREFPPRSSCFVLQHAINFVLKATRKPKNGTQVASLRPAYNSEYDESEILTVEGGFWPKRFIGILI